METSLDLDNNKVEEKDEETQKIQSKMATLPVENFVSKFTSCRWQIVYMCMMCMLLVFAFRHSFNFSIVCMEYDVFEYVNDTVLDNITGLNATTQVIKTVTVNPYVPIELRGLVLSCYFYGYVLTPLIGGYLGAKFGPKLMIGVAMTVAIVITVILPIGFRFNIYLIVALRFTMGFFSGCVLPSMQVLLSNWSPVDERTQLGAVSNSGVNIGNIFATFVSGFLCTIPVDDGWPLPFYAYGSLGAVWLLLWMYLVYDTPDQHPRCSLQEKQRIYYGKTSIKAAQKALPWKRTLRNMPFWSLVVNHIAFSWITNTVQTFLPIYMSDVLKFQITENGVLSSLPSIGRFIGSLVFSFLADRIIRTTSMGVTANRKIFQTFGTVIPGCLLIGLSFLDSDQRILAVALMTLTMTFQAFTTASYRVNHIDIAPRYAGQVMGFTLTCGSCSAIISPLVTSALTMERTREQWQFVFFLTSGIVIAADVVFVIFASGQEQDWAKDRTESRHSTVSQDGPNKDANSYPNDSTESPDVTDFPNTSNNSAVEEEFANTANSNNDVNSYPNGSTKTSNDTDFPKTSIDVNCHPNGSNEISNDTDSQSTFRNVKSENSHRYKGLDKISEECEISHMTSGVLEENETNSVLNRISGPSQIEQTLYHPSFRYNMPSESAHLDTFSDIFVSGATGTVGDATSGFNNFDINNCREHDSKDNSLINSVTCTTRL